MPLRVKVMFRSRAISRYLLFGTGKKKKSEIQRSQSPTLLQMYKILDTMNCTFKFACRGAKIL